MPPGRIEDFAKMSHLVAQLLPKDLDPPSPSDLILAFCRVASNSLTISDDELNNVGAGLYSTLSILNHSCDPNVFVVFQGTKAILKAARKIIPGEELLHSYVDLADSKSLRQKRLKETYFFDCRCSRCMSVVRIFLRLMN